MARINARNMFLWFLVALLVAFVAMVQRFLIPAGLAIVTAVLLYPWYVRMLARMPKRRYVAAFSTVLLTICLILIPISFITFAITAEVTHSVDSAVHYLQRGGFDDTLGAANQYVADLPDSVRNLLGPNFDLRQTAASVGREAARMLYQISPKIVGIVIQLGFIAAMWLLFLFFCFADGARLYAIFVDLFPAAPRHQALIAQRVREMIVAVVFGMLATSFANAILMASAFAFIGLPQPLTWGFVTFGLSTIPLIGSFLVWGSASVYLLLAGQWPAALGLTLFGLIIIGQADNVIKPLVMRGKVNIHPVLLFVSILGGLEFMGPTGLVFGPILVAVVLASLQIYRAEYALVTTEPA